MTDGGEINRSRLPIETPRVRVEWSPQAGGSSEELYRVTPHSTAQIKTVTGTYDCLIQWGEILHSQQCHFGWVCGGWRELFTILLRLHTGIYVASEFLLFQFHFLSLLQARSLCLAASRPVMNNISVRNRKTGDQNCTSSSLIRCLQLLKSFDLSAENEA